MLLQIDTGEGALVLEIFLVDDVYEHLHTKAIYIESKVLFLFSDANYNNESSSEVNKNAWLHPEC